MGVYKTSFLRASIISHIPGKVSAQGLRFRVQGSGFRVHGFKVQGSGFPDEIGIVGSPQTRLALQGTSGQARLPSLPAIALAQARQAGDIGRGMRSFLP